MPEKVPQTITKITPLELAIIDFVDGEYRNSKALIAINPDIVNLEPTNPEYRDCIRIIDLYSPPGQWRSTNGSSKWLLDALKKLLTQPTEETSK